MRADEGDPIWRLWVDTGGTFTDCLGVSPQGVGHRLKILSSSALRGQVGAVEGARRALVELAVEAPAGFFRGFTFRLLGGTEHALVVGSGADGALELDRDLLRPSSVGATCELGCSEEAPVLAARLMTATPPDGELPPTELRLATTRGTNALLERAGARVALFVTRGFRDLLAIGDQARPDLFALDIVKPEPLYERVVEVDGRLDRDGVELTPLDADSALAEARLLVADGVGSAAVALLHSYRNPDHERELTELLEQAGFDAVARSSELAPLIKIVPRAQTAVVDAYLAPVIGSYLGSVTGAFGDDHARRRGGRVLVMTSAGGLEPIAGFRAKDSLLSGPAGGVVGAAASGRAAGFDHLLTFDMGGTSTDVARYAGDFAYTFELQVGDARVITPALRIETVAAGGGSICAWESGQLRVGPHSAGADPGPACYGAGGPLTLTDVNLLLGRIDPERFEIPLDVEAARRRAAAIANEGGSVPDDLDVLLEGFLRIADERMAEAIRRVSVQEGFDPARHALLSFGGAGGQHACAIAGLLGVSTVLVPADASLLSAVGLGVARIERFAHRQVLRPLAELGAQELLEVVSVLAEESCGQVREQQGEQVAVSVRRVILRLRLVGQDSTLDLELGADERPSVDELRRRFGDLYRSTFGYLPERPVEVESVRVVASTESEEELYWTLAADPAGVPTIDDSIREAFLGGSRREVPVVDRAALGDRTLEGPVLITERRSCTVVEPGWTVRRDPSGCLVVERREGRRRSGKA